MNKPLDPRITVRPAIDADVAWLALWNDDPTVISATSDDAAATVAFDCDWADELAQQDEYSRYYIGEVDGRPIGAMQIIDPHREVTHYWGEIEPNVRAVDIWIGAAADRGKGHGEAMMRCAFYCRLGFVPTHRQVFSEKDDCLVHRLTRAEWSARFSQDAAGAE